LLLSKS